LVPNSAEAYNGRGAALERLGKYDEAIKDYTRVTELMPFYAIAYSNKAQVYDDLGNLDSAMLYSMLAIKIDPNNDIAYHTLGYAYVRWGNYKKALKNYDKCLQVNGDNTIVIPDLITWLVRLRQFDEVATYYNRMKTNRGDSSLRDYQETYLNAVMQFVSGRNAEALAEANKADKEYKNYRLNNPEEIFREKNEHADIFALKGFILEKLNSPAEALTAFKDALTLNASQPDVKDRVNALAKSK
jgi:tetratricopeptide (TPR) repeat protein